ncbi:hypothetical protein [Sporosalibacterium faouarense]|nr:hypothetical protein [Sporosalibacterium faouarense]
MNIETGIILGVIFFVILISIQYSLNRILVELKNIKKLMVNNQIKDRD